MKQTITIAAFLGFFIGMGLVYIFEEPQPTHDQLLMGYENGETVYD